MRRTVEGGTGKEANIPNIRSGDEHSLVRVSGAKEGGGRKKKKERGKRKKEKEKKRKEKNYHYNDIITVCPILFCAVHYSIYFKKITKINTLLL